MNYNVNRISKEFCFNIDGASYIGAPRDNTMMFISRKVGHLISNLFGHKECLVVAENGIEVPSELTEDNCFIFTENPQLIYAKIATDFESLERQQEKTLGYKLTEGGFYIGNNVEIGENAYIEPNVFIGNDCKIGNNACILCGTVIRNSIIGDNFVSNEYAVVGANGFTIAEDESGIKIRIPSLGKVHIGNNVEIGAFDNISRGTGGNTIIEDNVKIDAHVHVGHDVHFGTNTEVTAGAIIGGFVNTDDHAYVGINAVVRNRTNLGSNAFIGMGAVVTKSVPDSTVVVGNPAKPFCKK